MRIVCLVLVLRVIVACQASPDPSPSASQEHTPADTSTLTATAPPTIASTLDIALPSEITQGIDALIHCAGHDTGHWLANGPPRMTGELVQCLNEYLEAN